MFNFEPYYLYGKNTSTYVTTPDVDSACIAQIHAMMSYDMCTEQIAVMPDTHVGAGTVIGFTMPLASKVSPAVVGSDQGCGMLSSRLEKNIYDSISRQEVDDLVRASVPFGQTLHNSPCMSMEKDFPWKDANAIASRFTKMYNEKFDTNFHAEAFSYKWFLAKCKEIRYDVGKAETSLGTLGGGNHFIEFGKDTSQNLWVTIHSGSRGMGMKLSAYWESIMAVGVSKSEAKIAVDAEAQRLLKTVKDRSTVPDLLDKFRKEFFAEHGSKPYLEGENAFNYLIDLIFGQQYASFSRKLMTKLIQKAVNCKVVDQIETVHNYVDFSDMIIRKGAIKGYENERVVIPYNMEDGIIICKGKSNPDWNCSLPHGAGRVGSRAWAKQNLDVEAAKESMKSKDIFSTEVPVDEVREAYKKTDVLEQAIAANATIVNRIIPVHNLKDGAVQKSFADIRREKRERKLSE